MSFRRLCCLAEDRKLCHLTKDRGLLLNDVKIFKIIKIKIFILINDYPLFVFALRYFSEHTTLYYLAKESFAT